MKHILLEMEKLKNLNSGLGQVCLGLGREFEKISPKECDLTFYIPALFKGSFGNQFHYLRRSAKHRFFKIPSRAYDVWHCLHQDSRYFPKNENTKLILTIHDLNFLEKYRGLRRARKLVALQRRVDRAQVITVISKFTENQVRENLNIKGKPLHVIPNGNSLDASKTAMKPSFIHFSSFIFTIGGVSKKKNFHVLLPLLQNEPNLHLVIAGDRKTAYDSEIESMARTLGISHRVHMPGAVNHEEKLWLYQHCLAFAFPSLQEGFGLPVVEAMSLGKPVFLSKLTSLPEVGGMEAHYWDNFEPDAMRAVLKKGLEEFSDEKAKRSIEWSKRFSWNHAAKEYLKLYQTL